MPDLAGRLKRLEEKLSVRIGYFDEISSTNDRAAAPEYGRRDVVWAESQTRGRGQRGNSGSSGAGENLTFSLVVCPENLPAEQQFYISKIVSVGLIEALAGSGVEAEIKWPNDIYIGDRKVAGILIENDLLGSRITKSVVGIGLNVNQAQFDPALPNPVSIYLATGKTVDRVEVLEKILERIFTWEEKLRAGQLAEIDRQYGQNLYRREGTHLFREPGGEPFSATIETVRPSGELLLRRTDGTLTPYLFKEVEFVIE